MLSVLESLREIHMCAHTHTPNKEAELEPEWKNEQVSVKTSLRDAQNKMTFKTFFYTSNSKNSLYITNSPHSIIFNMGITILQNKYFPLLYLPFWYFFYPSFIF